MKKLLGIVVLGLLFCSNVYGKNNPGLKGLDGFRLDIVYEGEFCGINKQKIETAVKYILANSKIKIGSYVQVIEVTPTS